jgi:glutamine amidotransferase
MIAIVDYGVGNLFSLHASLKYIGQEAEITGDSERLERADRIILPGVGAFGDAAVKLRDTGLGEAVSREAKKGKPLLGICLGMQLLFEESFEFGRYEGLALLKGVVAPIKDRLPGPIVADRAYKVPHIGWNALVFPKSEKSPLFKFTNEGEHVYFVHSYHAEGCADSIIAAAEYGVMLTAAVGLGNVMGTQFHPEKSGDVGLNILRAFTQL